MNTKRVFTPTPFELTKKDYFIVDFLHRNIIILNSLEGLFHFIQLMRRGTFIYC